jgi:hypothetical protein
VERYGHVLVIGGTGMLAGASRDLASRCDVLTSVARTARSLRALADTLPEGAGAHHTLALDWSEPDSFLSALAAHVEQVGAPSLVVAWLHKDDLGPEIAQRVAGGVAAPEISCTFFQVRGSAAAAPSADVATPDPRIPPGVAYHEVILGFRVEGARSRWLTHEEISGGVLDAIAHPSPRTIIGTVTPWDRRP